MKAFRLERDALGKIRLPAQAYYSIQTWRAFKNFPISGLKPDAALVNAFVLIKKACARANRDLGRLEKKTAAAIDKACAEILKGRLRQQFIVDIFQMGAGTSFHMNVNEVVANRAEEILGGKRGEHRLVHPHDHVNMGQSTNDVFPTAMRLSASVLMQDHLFSSLKNLEESFFRKAVEFDSVLKSGRTHLQDAAPIRLGQEFGAYARTLTRCREFLENASRSLLELGIGGTAVGTGLNTAPGFARLAVKNLAAMTALKLKEAADLREAMQSMRPMTEVSAALRNLAIEVNRIANDLRLLSSGPRTGLGEISLPAVAPGSSIMPGKVNPSMPEMMNMVCYQVIGCDAVVCGASQAGQLELNVMMPVISFNLNFMIQIMGNALRQLRTRCIDGIRANVERCRDYAERSMGLATALTPWIGYDSAARVAKEAVKSGSTLKDVLEKKKILPPGDIQKILNPDKMTEPGIPGPQERRKKLKGKRI